MELLLRLDAILEVGITLAMKIAKPAAVTFSSLAPLELVTAMLRTFRYAYERGMHLSGFHFTPIGCLLLQILEPRVYASARQLQLRATQGQSRYEHL